MMVLWIFCKAKQLSVRVKSIKLCEKSAVLVGWEDNLIILTELSTFAWKENNILAFWVLDVLAEFGSNHDASDILSIDFDWMKGYLGG